jgi:hypothetical protein
MSVQPRKGGVACVLMRISGRAQAYIMGNHMFGFGAFERSIRPATPDHTKRESEGTSQTAAARACSSVPIGFSSVAWLNSIFDVCRGQARGDVRLGPKLVGLSEWRLRRRLFCLLINEFHRDSNRAPEDRHRERFRKIHRCVWMLSTLVTDDVCMFSGYARVCQPYPVLGALPTAANSNRLEPTLN